MDQTGLDYEPLLSLGSLGCNNMGVVESNQGAGVELTSQAPH